MKQKVLLFIFLFSMCCPAFCQTDITLYEQFNGRYDFTFAGNTLNTMENGTGGPCDILTSSSAELNLDPDDIIYKAYLYWAGSGTGDLDVTLNGQPVSAERTFPLTFTFTDNTPREYFGAFADVTAQVQATGNGTYTLSDFDLTDLINGDTGTNLYCQNATNFGGWAIFVVYENDNLPLNQLNLYDGMQNVPYSVDISLPSLNVVDNIGAKIGFLAWEGDKNISVNESLRINGNILFNDLNPANNAFNGTNSFTGSDQLYNMDLDVYDIQNNIQIGDTSAQIQLTSNQDFVMINAIVTKLNSQLPDATIHIDNITKTCGSRIINVDYTVSNVNSTDVLPAGTPVAIYLNGELIATTATQADIPIGGSESGTITITIPDDAPLDFDLLFSADDQGNGTGIVTETDENNNSDSASGYLNIFPDIEPGDLTSCDIANGAGVGIFDFSGYAESLKIHPTDTVTFHLTETGAENNDPPITNPDSFTSTSSPQEIYVRLEDADGCYTVASFTLTTELCADAIVTINTLAQQCDSRELSINYTVSNPGDIAIAAGMPLAVYAGNTLITFINIPEELPPGSSYTTDITFTVPTGVPDDFNLMFAADDDGTGTGIINEVNEDNNTATMPVTLWVSPVLQQPQDVTACETFNGSGVGSFDFSGYQESLKNNPEDTVTFYTTQEGAATGNGGEITNVGSFEASDGQQVFVRLENQYGCYDTASFTLHITDCYFPDATIVIEEVYKQCNSRIIHVHYTVYNGGTDVLPAATPIAIYVNGQYLDSTFTLDDIAIGDSESNYITLTIPVGIPLDFDLTFTVDDTGNGTGIVQETDETNNDNTLPTSLVLSPVLQQPDDVVQCDEGFGLATFDFSGYAETLKNYPDETVTFYNSQPDADQELNPISNTSAFTITENPQRIYVRLDNGTCHTTASFLLKTQKCKPTTYNYITPNGDGINDTFFVKGLRNVFLNFKMSIYNRWGELIWTGDNSTDDWDGIANVKKVGSQGTTVPNGTYYFVLELNDPDFPEPVVGWVYVTK